MKKSLIFGLSLFSAFAFGQTTIQDARTNFAVGQTVTIRGIATNGSELGPIRYIQDATGALPAYGSSQMGSVLRGDSVTVTGVLKDYMGLLEIDPVSSKTVHGQKPVPAAISVPISNIGESIEGQLIRLSNVTFATPTGNFVGNTNYTVTDGTNTFQLRISTGTNLVGQAIPSGAVTITGLVSQFNATYQLLARDQNDIIAYVAPQQEINIKIGGNNVLTGDTYVVGNTAATTITIENSGVGTLNVTGATFTGTNAADFSTPFTSTTVAGGATGTFVVNYAPAGPGTRTATLNIASNDADENPYLINLVAVGTDGLATEPTANPSNLVFSNVKAYTFTGSYTAGTGAEKYIVLWKNSSSPITAVPVDGTHYEKGDLLGDAKVAYIGPATTFIPRGVIANQNFQFAVYAFNGPNGFENYKTTAPATGTVSSQGSQTANYYAGITTAAPNFLQSLSAKINPHTVITYAAYKSTVMQQFEVKDTTLGRSYVTCSYSGEKKVFNEPFDWTAQGYSREHTFSHSWMPSYPADGTSPKPEYSDQHNLYPVNQTQANSPRSNLPMDEITGSVVFTYLEGRVGYNGSQLVYQPRDAHKGNAARSIMYMATAYNGISGNNWKIPSYQSQEILKTWHSNDLPDNYEIARHEYIYGQQGNRNPYIDSVQFACYVDFSAMTQLPLGCGGSTIGIEEQLAASFVVFPNPANEKLYLQVNETSISAYEIIDMQGRKIMSEKVSNVPVVELNTSSLRSGSYLVKVSTPYGDVQRALIIE